jgi:hypothetical protein
MCVRALVVWCVPLRKVTTGLVFVVVAVLANDIIAGYYCFFVLSFGVNQLDVALRRVVQPWFDAPDSRMANLVLPFLSWVLLHFHMCYLGAAFVVRSHCPTIALVMVLMDGHALYACFCGPGQLLDAASIWTFWVNTCFFGLISLGTLLLVLRVIVPSCVAAQRLVKVFANEKGKPHAHKLAARAAGSLKGTSNDVEA